MLYLAGTLYYLILHTLLSRSAYVVLPYLRHFYVPPSSHTLSNLPLRTPHRTALELWSLDTAYAKERASRMLARSGGDELGGEIAGEDICGDIAGAMTV